MPEQTKSIYDSLFGTMPSTQEAAAARDARFQDLLNARRQVAETQRTSDARMAQFAAIGNALTTMVQPLGWAVRGATGGVQPTDNRQYLEAFNRALKDQDDVRNIGNADLEYRFKLADEAYRRQLALQDQRNAAAIADEKEERTFQRRSDIYLQQHLQRLAEIDRRADAQLELARVRANFHVTRNGVPLNEKMMSTSWTAYLRYLEKARTEERRGAPSAGRIMSFDEFLGTPEGGGYSVTPVIPQAPAQGGGAAQQTGATGSTAQNPAQGEPQAAAPKKDSASKGGQTQKKGGFQAATPAAKSEKKGGFQR